MLRRVVIRVEGFGPVVVDAGWSLDPASCGCAALAPEVVIEAIS